MSSWIKLDQSFSRLERKNNRTKRIHCEPNIEDDSSQENCNFSSSSSMKKRKLKPLENLTIETQEDSSDECGSVEYNPDGFQLPNIEKRKIKPTLPFVTSAAPLPRQFTASHSTSTTKLHPWQSWASIPKSNDDMQLLSKIDDSLTDSDEGSSQDTVIDESSTDSSPIQSQIVIQQETLIETQDSITPPVEPFLTNTSKLPKKRRVRMVKGGMVERLKKCLSQAKSNVLFWHHHRSAELIAPGTLVNVNRVEKTYGRILIHAKVDDKETIFCFCSRSLEIQEGDAIEVQFDIDRCYETDTHVLYSYVDKVLPIKEVR